MGTIRPGVPVHVIRFIPAVLTAVLGLALAACGRAPAPAAPTQPAANAAWQAFVDGYVEQSLRAQPMFAVQQGRHDFDGRMPDLSRNGIRAEVLRLQAARAATGGFAPDGLNAAQRFEREYLLAEIGAELFWLDEARWPFRNPAWYVNQLDPEVYLSREYAPLPQRLRGYLGYARAIPGIAAAIRANLATPLPRSYVDYAVKAFGGFADFLEHDVPVVFAAVNDAAAQQELRVANAPAVQAMRGLRDWFAAQRATANDGYALGPELYAAMLRETDGLGLSIAQVKAAGEADVVRNTASLKEACAAYVPGASVAQCVAKVHVRKPPEGPVGGARRQLGMLRDFVRQQDLVTIPGDEQARVEEAPPYNRANSAYTVIPGPFEKNVATVYAIAPPDPSWNRREQLDYIKGEAELLNTTIHEVWPGHFLQFLHSNRAASVIGRLYVGYAFAEGWAHYSEELLWEAGLEQGNPENHVAQLADALYRDARLLASIGLHTEGMSVAQSEQLFRNISYTDPGNARQQAARGTYDPEYLNYTLGKLQIRKLRDDWIALELEAHPGTRPRDFWKAFHDRFLSFGGPQLPLVRRAMLPGDAAAPL